MKRMLKVLLYSFILINAAYSAQSAPLQTTNPDIVQLNTQLQEQMKQLQIEQQKQLQELNIRIQNQMKQQLGELQTQIQSLNNQTQAQLKQLKDSLEQEILQVQKQTSPAK